MFWLWFTLDVLDLIQVQILAWTGRFHPGRDLSLHLTLLTIKSRIWATFGRFWLVRTVEKGCSRSPVYRTWFMTMYNGNIIRFIPSSWPDMGVWWFLRPRKPSLVVATTHITRSRWHPNIRVLRFSDWLRWRWYFLGEVSFNGREFVTEVLTSTSDSDLWATSSSRCFSKAISRCFILVDHSPHILCKVSTSLRWPQNGVGTVRDPLHGHKGRLPVTDRVFLTLVLGWMLFNSWSLLKLLSISPCFF